MIDKEKILAMRLEVLGVTLDGLDFKDEPIEQGVWEGLVFNIGKLLLEHLEEHRSSNTKLSDFVEVKALNPHTGDDNTPKHSDYKLYYKEE